MGLFSKRDTTDTRPDLTAMGWAPSPADATTDGGALPGFLRGVPKLGSLIGPIEVEVEHSTAPGTLDPWAWVQANPGKTAGAALLVAFLLTRR